MLALSARSEAALKALVGQYQEHLKHLTVVSLQDLCYTANSRRDHYKHRLAFVVRDMQELQEQIAQASECELGEVGFYGEAVAQTDSARNQLAAEKVRELQGLSADETALTEIARLYVVGADVPWEDLDKRSARRLVPLPAYPFEPHRCWIKLPKIPVEAEQNLFQMKWQDTKQVEATREEMASAPVLIFQDEEGRGEMLADRLRGQGRSVVNVSLGASFGKIAEGRYEIGTSEADYGRLLAELRPLGIGQVVHLSTLRARAEQAEVSTREGLQEALERGVYGLFHLVQALVQNQYKDSLELFLVTEGAHAILPDDEVVPEPAALIGLGKVVSAEYANIRVRSVDVDRQSGIDCLLAELAGESQEDLVGYREGRRYREVIERVSDLQDAGAHVEIQSDGVYVITGGTGGLGLEIASEWARQNPRVNLALLSRKGLPDRVKWNAILEDGTDALLCDKLRRLIEMEQQGAEVVVAAVDVSDAGALQKVLDGLRASFGKIRGVVHAAGVAGDGFLIRKDRETLQNVLAPKIAGTWALDHLTREDALEFFVMFSSINSLMGEAGQGDYTAANNYLDAYAHYRTQSGHKTLAINWPAWKETGMAVAYGVNHDLGAFKSISTETALTAFQQVLGQNLSRVIVGELNPQSDLLADLDRFPLAMSQEMRREIEQNRTPRSASGDAGQEAKASARRMGQGASSYAEVEEQVAAIWCDVLGFESIDVSDNFFDIGGTSILITNVQQQIEELYPKKVTVVDLFTYTTVAELARYIYGEEEASPVASAGEPEREAGASEDDFLKLFEAIEDGTLSLDSALAHYKSMEEGEEGDG